MLFKDFSGNRHAEAGSAAFSYIERVVALDLMATLVIGIVAVYSAATGQSAYLDVAIVLALIAFLGTVVFAYYTGDKRNRELRQKCYGFSHVGSIN